VIRSRARCAVDVVGLILAAMDSFADLWRTALNRPTGGQGDLAVPLPLPPSSGLLAPQASAAVGSVACMPVQAILEASGRRRWWVAT